MIIDETSFHDSQILNVTENSSEQIIDFLLSFPTDWENSVFENKILRFEDVVLYHLEEIPFAGLPTILNIVNLGVVKKDFGSGKNFIQFGKHHGGKYIVRNLNQLGML